MSKALDRFKRPTRKSNIRISKPTFQPEKFREVILYILDKTGDLSEIELEEILYFIDFDYYQVVEEHLTGATYKKEWLCASTSKLKPALKELIKLGAIEKGKVGYISLKKPDLSLFNKGEKFMLGEVTEHYFKGPGRMQNPSTDVPVIVTQPNCRINYESVFYRTPSFCARERLYEKSKALEKQVKTQSKAIKNNMMNF